MNLIQIKFYFFWLETNKRVHKKWQLEMTSIYDGQFYENVLVVGRTGCGKTTFLEKLGVNNFFGKIVKTEWTSGIDIDKQREAEIESYFSKEIEVHVAKEV